VKRCKPDKVRRESKDHLSSGTTINFKAGDCVAVVAIVLD
jgi:hypothetical protein